MSEKTLRFKVDLEIIGGNIGEAVENYAKIHKDRYPDAAFISDGLLLALKQEGRVIETPNARPRGPGGYVQHIFQGHPSIDIYMFREIHAEHGSRFLSQESPADHLVLCRMGRFPKFREFKHPGGYSLDQSKSAFDISLKM